MGISFAGGLSIVAAGRPAIRARVTSVLSFGGHGDLPRTLRYLLTGIQPDGVERPPHDYGVAIILLGVADRVVPTGQVEPLRAAIWSFLEASRLHAIDIARAEDEFARARELAAALPEPAQSYMHLVNARDVARLGPLLLPYITELAGDHALSPARSDAPACPVYLLHGTDDNVIPAVESILLAEDLRKRGTWVDVLLTPLITHADVDRSPTLPEIWRLVTFWGGLLKN
jgi:pimeloyl-ACP methyl ester carboxylesterase